MKTLIVIYLGIGMYSLGFNPAALSLTTTPSIESEKQEMCTLSITGYANFGEFGRRKVTMTAEAETCEEAAEELRAEIIERQLTINK